uniref:LEF-5 n=1 Tax=Nilaparvata lugens endogenous nudivirus TaxID=1487700 RepID=X5GYA1_9VIRU|nr:LEF-5 [Nilaparvata lugens endogenous nudivirus]
MFYTWDDDGRTPGGGRMLIATASTDLPAPQFTFDSLFKANSTTTTINIPCERPTKYLYSDKKCVHNYTDPILKQLRRGDEALSSIRTCKKCGFIKCNI